MELDDPLEFIKDKLPDNDSAKNRYLVYNTDKSRELKIEQTQKGWVCDCEHFRFRLRKTGSKCKHIQKLLSFIEPF